jgi:hypothetical protein
MSTIPSQQNQPAGPPVDAKLPPSETVSAPSVLDLIDLPNGKEFNEVIAARLAASRPVRLVVFAGEVDCGKTTLLTSLYELFQWNRVPEYCFAGSNTLPAFEQRCYLGRMDSENTTPDTQRTPYNGPDPHYLHMRIVSVSSPRNSSDFLFTDVSGEMFEHARNSTDECKQLIFLQRASDFLLLLDGEKCVRADERHSVVQKSKTLIQSCLDCKMLSNYCVVNVVWTKFDYFDADANKEANTEFRTEVVRDFRTTFEHRLACLKFSEVAARPTKAPHLGFGNGVAALLNGWMTTRPQFAKLDVLPNAPVGTRESELFGLRHFADTDRS